MDNQQPHETLGGWLKTARTERGLSLRRLAEIANVRHTTIDKIERGGGAREDTLALLVSALASTPEEASALLQEAKAASAGLPPPNPAIEALAARLASLSTEDQQYVLSLIERLLQSQSRQE
jgi:transcriptional regulator with XRE-family HTH domain